MLLGDISMQRSSYWSCMSLGAERRRSFPINPIYFYSQVAATIIRYWENVLVCEWCNEFIYPRCGVWISYVSVLCLRKSIHNQIVSSFLGTNTTGKARLVWGASITIIGSMLSILFLSKSLPFGPDRYGTECVGLTAGWSNSSLSVRVSPWPSCSSYTDWNGSIMRMKSAKYAAYSSYTSMELRQISGAWI